MYIVYKIYARREFSENSENFDKKFELSENSKNCEKSNNFHKNENCTNFQNCLNILTIYICSYEHMLICKLSENSTSTQK